MAEERKGRTEPELWDRLPVALYRTTADGRFLEVNEEFLRLFGYPGRETLFRTPVEALHEAPGGREEWKKSFGPEEVLRGKDARFRRADGSLFHARETSRVVKREDDSIAFYEGVIEDVTEARRAADALSESRRLLAQAQRIATLGSWSWCVETNTVTWSDELYRIFGRSREEFPATLEGYLSCVHPNDRGKVRANIETALGDRGKFQTTERIVRPDGEVRWLESRGEVALGETGEALEMSGVCQDVTERRNSEERLRKSEDRFRRYFELGVVGMAITSATKGWIEVNDRLCQILGYDRRELETKTWADLTHPDDLATDAAQFERVLAGAIDAYTLEKRYIRKDGGIVRASISVRCLRDPDGRVDSFLGILEDVTPRKKAEEEQALFRRVIEQTPDSIVITDAAGSIVYVNPAFEKVSGYTRSEALGKNPRILKSGHQDAAFYRRMWETLARGEVWTGILVNRRKDGAIFQEQATIGPVHDSSGRLVNYVAVKRDVSREASLERQLLQSQKMEAVGRLAGGIAHDFNNLLGVITGYGEILKKQLDEKDPLRWKAEQILKAADRAARLTRQLLAFSRHQVLQPRVLELNAIVSKMSPMLQRLIGEDIELVTRLDGEAGRIRADPGQVEQVVMNLVVNARDAMKGGGKLTIETHATELESDRAQRPGPHVMLAVSDTGVGMDVETQSRVFEPFFTTKELGQGTGLGLSSVYGIVQQSEGYVWLYSEVGLGTTFKVYFPRVEAELLSARQELPQETARGHETVLLIEDEESLRNVMSEALEDGGYTVLVAEDGAAALEVAQAYTGPVHLLVTDVIMPKMTGHEVVKRISPLRSEMKVLYVSGYTDEAIASHGILAPGSSFLSKPFGPEVLLRKVRAVLGSA